MVTLTENERISLYYTTLNIYETTKQKHYEVLSEILRCGYTSEYYRLNEWFLDELPAADQALVIEILSLYQALQASVPSGGKVPPELEFEGFDGNNESLLYGYLKFVVEDDEKFTHVVTGSTGLNSHAPMAAKYRRMLSVWKAAGSPHPVNPTLQKSILA